MEGDPRGAEGAPLPISIGINGFRSLGRAVLFASFTEPQVTVTAINDFSTSIDYIVYVLQTESPLSAEDKASITVVGDFIFYRGTEKIRVTQKHDLVDIAWRDAGVNYVVECTGFTSTRDRCWGHLTGGARGVVIAGQSGDAPIVVTGVNDSDLSKIQPIISSGSPIAVALAPLVRVLHDRFGVVGCSYTAIHGPQPVEPTASKSANPQDWRQTRVSTDSITPYSQTGREALCKLLPFLTDRLSASVFQVPVTKGCAIDFLIQFGQSVDKSVVVEVLAEAAREHLHNVLLVSKRDLTSRDVEPNGKLYFEETSMQCTQDGNTHQLTLWFDPEGSFAKRLLSLTVVMNDADAKRSSG